MNIVEPRVETSSTVVCVRRGDTLATPLMTNILMPEGSRECIDRECAYRSVQIVGAAVAKIAIVTFPLASRDGSH